MKKKIITLLSLVLASFMLCSCGNSIGRTNNNDENNISTNNSKEEKGGESVMKIELVGKEYELKLQNNITVDNILKNIPLELNMVRYAEHEYYDKLNFKPIFAEERTSNIKAGHVYYWDGWNALVINYIDYDISPYEVVHIGEITDKSIIDLLENAEDETKVSVRES